MYHIHNFAPYLVDSVLEKHSVDFCKTNNVIETGKPRQAYITCTQNDFKSRTSVALIPLLGNPRGKHAAEANF